MMGDHMSDALSETATKYRRVMLKISGEALMGDQGFGLHPPTVARVAKRPITASIQAQMRPVSWCG